MEVARMRKEEMWGEDAGQSDPPHKFLQVPLSINKPGTVRLGHSFPRGEAAKSRGGIRGR